MFIELADEANPAPDKETPQGKRGSLHSADRMNTRRDGASPGTASQGGRQR